VIKWISEHRTWLMLLIVAIGSILYIGYTSYWEPLMMVAVAKEGAGTTVSATRNLIDFFLQDDMIDFIKVLTPIILPIITWRKRKTLDKSVTRTTNKVVREKLHIGDRRKNETPVQIEHRRQQSEANKKNKNK